MKQAIKIKNKKNEFSDQDISWYNDQVYLYDKLSEKTINDRRN